jgi:hypothetical protein
MMKRGRSFVNRNTALRLFFAVALLGCGVVAARETEPLAARQAAARVTVNEALQREIYGPYEDRRTLLQEAAQRDPVLLSAKWQQGLVQTPTEGWVTPEEFKLDPKSQRQLVEYKKLRSEAADTVSANLAIANWCAERKMLAQEQAHLSRVVGLAPDHVEAHRRLGHEQVGREWFTAKDAQRQRELEVACSEALAKYREPLKEILRDLQHRSQLRQARGRKKLDELSDPAALPAIEEVLGSAGGESSALAIDKIGQFEGQEPSLALCRFALFAPQEPLRRLAADKLANRDRNDYVPWLLDLLSLPLKSRFVAVALPGGLVNYQHVVIREGRTRRDIAVFNRQHLSEIQAIPEASANGEMPSLDDRMGVEQAAAAAEATDGLKDAARIAGDREIQILQANTSITQVNNHVMALLTKTTDQTYITPDAWWGWWLQEGDRIQVTKYTTVSQQYTSKGMQSAFKFRPTYSRPVSTRSCFAAGTPVWTVDGTVAIEKVQVGDLVLSKNIDSGELCYKPVLETTVRPPSPLVTFEAGEDTFSTSKGHLFWEPGVGWVQARRLHEGTMLHAASGPVRVTSIDVAAPQLTYNLVVSDFNTYFVGEEKVLSHDVTVEEPTNVIVPGLEAR